MLLLQAWSTQVLFSLKYALKCCFGLSGVHLKLGKAFICLAILRELESGSQIWPLSISRKSQVHLPFQNNIIADLFFDTQNNVFINTKQQELIFFVACNAGIFWQLSSSTILDSNLEEACRQKSVLVPKPTWQ